MDNKRDWRLKSNPPLRLREIKSLGGCVMYEASLFFLVQTAYDPLVGEIKGP